MIFFAKNNSQFSKKKTATVLDSQIDNWLRQINLKSTNSIHQLDLSKGFKTINIEILL